MAPVNARTQRLCAWAGPATVVLFFIGFGGVAGFLPPPNPENSSAETARMFAEDKTTIRLGLLLSMFAAALFAPLVAVISVQLKRIEGPHSPLANTQLALGALLTAFFIFPIMWWQTAAFRQERSDESIQLLNDLAWIPFVGVVSTGVVQTIAVGIAILQDTREHPIFPRWIAYYSFWSAAIFVPGGVIVFFKDGPFAWDGIIGFWVVLVVFAAWILLMTFAVLRAIDAQVNEATPTPEATPRAELDDLKATVATLQSEVSRLTTSRRL